MGEQLSKMAVLRRQISHVLELFRRAGIKYHHVLIPLAFSIIIAGMTAMGLGLLVPLASGLAKQDFSDALGMPVGGAILSFLTDTSSKEQVLFGLVGLIFVVNTANFFLKYLFQRYTAYWHGIFAMNSADHVVGRLLCFSRKYYDEHSQGAMQQVIGFSSAILSALSLLQTSVNSILQLACRLTVILVISIPVTLGALLMFPVLHLSVDWMRTGLGRLADQQTEEMKELGRDEVNMLSSIDLIRSYSNEGPMRERLRLRRNRLRELHLKSYYMQALVQPIQDTLILTALLLLVLAATHTIGFERRDKIAELVVLFYVARSALPYFTALLQARLDLVTHIPKLKEIWNILEQTEAYIVPSGDYKMPPLETSIELKGLTFSYDDRSLVLRNVHLVIPKGKTLALVGTTGSGKSTIVKLLMRFYDCPANSIFVDGVDIRAIDINTLRDRIDYISQDVLVFNDTLRANLIFGLTTAYSDSELWGVLEQVELAGSLRKHGRGLEILIGDRGVRLSGGEKQRLAWSRALLRRKEILFLDEATSALDSRTEQVVQRTLAAGSKDRTTLVIAHRLSTVSDADLVAVMKGGTVIEQGRFEELLSRRGAFFAMWETYQGRPVGR